MIKCKENLGIFEDAASQVLNRTMEISTSNPIPPLVIIGRVNKNVKRCLQEAVERQIKESGNNFSTMRPNIVTVNDLIDGSPHHNNLTTWLESIQLGWSTIYLLLDQFVLSMSSYLIMTSHYPLSTFQLLIQRRHESREQNLAAMGFS